MLEERIYKDYVNALKNRDKHKTDFLSFVRAELKNKAISLRKEKLDDAEAIDVLAKQKKNLEETKESVSSSTRKEMAENIDGEIAILKEYLPESLDNESISRIIDEAIIKLAAVSIKDMGKVMKEITTKVRGRADLRKVSEIVRQKLSV